MKSQAFEYQCTHEVGKEGAGYISTAIGLGTIKHPELAMTTNPWYTIVPTVLPLTSVEEQQIKDFAELSTNFSTSKGKVNYLVDLIAGGFTIEGMGSAASAVYTVSETWNGKTALYIRNGAWELLQDYYESLLG
jgi:putative aldouronate transport system substrate-binding protein